MALTKEDKKWILNALWSLGETVVAACNGNNMYMRNYYDRFIQGNLGEEEENKIQAC